jgi:hypothetical protein
MAENDTDKTGSESDEDKAKTGTGTNDTNTGNQGASGDQGVSGTDKNEQPAVTVAEFEAMRERMKAADRAKADAETKLREIERKDMSELDKAKTDLQDRDAQIKTLTEKVSEMALQNAFLTNNKYTWHDPEDALRLLNREGVEVGEDGKVKGLAPAIAELAKKKPHLLKSEKDDSKDGNGNGSPAASGSATNGKRKGEGSDDKVDYSRRFPALKR